MAIALCLTAVLCFCEPDVAGEAKPKSKDLLCVQAPVTKSKHLLCVSLKALLCVSLRKRIVGHLKEHVWQGIQAATVVEKKQVRWIPSGRYWKPTDDRKPPTNRVPHASLRCKPSTPSMRRGGLATEGR